MTDTPATTPPPGSALALQQGCICAVIDNHYGRGVPDGRGGRLHWITAGCPVHRPAEAEEGG